MLTRRSFLLSTIALTLAQLTSGCSGQTSDLRVRLLKNSIPPQLLKEFRQQLVSAANLDIEPESDLIDILELLQNWLPSAQEESSEGFQLPFRDKKVIPADLVTLGNYWLEEAIQENLISPLNLESLQGWEKLPPLWQKLVKRNERGEIDDNGEIWGAPYRWGMTLIAYRQDKMEELGWIPTDWEDLWREEVRDRISILDSPREVIGLTLKKLGYSYNTEDLQEVPNLKQELLTLNEQILLYASQAYLEPLILGDSWIAVGWSSDILPIIKRYPNINAIAPRSGSSLWTDLWVQPASATGETLWQDWIEFCWKPRSANLISLFTSGSSPILLNLNPTEISEDLQGNPILLPDEDIIANSDFILPLSEPVQEDYLELWKEIRMGQ